MTDEIPWSLAKGHPLRVTPQQEKQETGVKPGVKRRFAFKTGVKPSPFRSSLFESFTSSAESKGGLFLRWQQRVHCLLCFSWMLNDGLAGEFACLVGLDGLVCLVCAWSVAWLLALTPLTSGFYLWTRLEPQLDMPRLLAFGLFKLFFWWVVLLFTRVF